MSVIYPQWVRKLTQEVAKEILFCWPASQKPLGVALASMERRKINLEKQNVKLNTRFGALHQILIRKI